MIPILTSAISYTNSFSLLGHWGTPAYILVACCAAIGIRVAFGFISPDMETRRNSVVLLISLLVLLLFSGYWLSVCLGATFLYAWYRLGLILLQKGFAAWICIVPVFVPLILLRVYWPQALEPWIVLFGLSFMSFRTAQLLIDRVQNISPIQFGAFQLYFPAVLIGPIVTWEQFHKEASCQPRPMYPELPSILRNLGWGLAHKFILAEALALYALPETVDIPWLDAITYSAFLFFDFSGYSLVAVGLAQIAGIRLPHNFNQPWLTTNPQDFWKRWHISLSDWLRIYVFRPTYRKLKRTTWGRKHGLSVQSFSLFVTLLIMGIWNGLEFRYIASGALFGLYSVIHNLYLSRHRGQILPSIAIFSGRIATLTAAIFALWVFSGRPTWIQHIEKHAEQIARPEDKVPQ